MTLIEQLWGSTNEKIHTLGTAFLGLSVIAFAVLRTDVKAQALVIFCTFALGVTLVGAATVRNSWSRWRTGEDSLVLLRRRDVETPVRMSAVHIVGWRIEWTGRVAHVDVGVFDVRKVTDGDDLPTGSRFERGYSLFRAAYWMACSSLAFQSIFGLAALGYGVWLLQFLFTYSQSKI